MEASKVFKQLKALKSFDHGDLTTNETVSEFIHFYPRIYWCPELLSTIVYDYSTGLYLECAGDEEIYKLMREYVNTRLEVSRILMQGALDGGDKKYLERCQRWADYARKSLSWSNINAAVSLWKKTQNIPNTKLNQFGNFMGTPVGILNVDETLLETLAYETLDKNWRYGDDAEVLTGENFFITKSTRGLIENSFDAYRSQTSLTPDERWYEFIDEITCHNQDLASYLCRALGYSVFLNYNPEEVMFIAHGASTRNGKSTLLNSVKYALGDYATSASNDFLVKKKFSNQGDKDELALLQGIRLLIISEPPQGVEIDESKTKSLTGNDAIVASKKYGHTFSFEPQFVMWMMSNSLPVIKDISLTESGRLQVIPFERHFTREDQDTTLKTRFRTERGMFTILNWLWRGYKDYKAQGLNPPQIVVEASKQLTSVSGNDFDRFIMAYLTHRTDARVLKSDFKKIYSSWCEQTGNAPMSSCALNNLLRERGFSGLRSNGKDFYIAMDFTDQAKEVLYATN